MNSMQRYILGLATVAAMIIVGIGLLLVFVLRGQHISQVAACRDAHTLISTIVLRSLGTNLEKYHQNPDAALLIYRHSLEANKLYHDNPELTDTAVTQTRDVMELADPRRCR